MAHQNASCKVEQLNARSACLRVKLAEELASRETSFAKESAELLKSYGIYIYGDRGRRKAGRATAADAPKRDCLMVRSKTPGGRLTCGQLLEYLDLCDELADGTLRITSRQALQLYAVSKRNVRQLVRRINQVKITTLGACGDVGRNVVCCPAPRGRDPAARQIQALAEELSMRLLSGKAEYDDFWLDHRGSGRPKSLSCGSHRPEVDPLYGDRCLPRKFKIGIASPEDNCVDLHTQDVGLLAVCEDSQVVGYNLSIGGGLGVTPGNRSTFSALARPLAFVPAAEVIDVVLSVVRVFRDFGDRRRRKRARLKYLLADWGLARLKCEVQRYHGRRLRDPRPARLPTVDDHLGWHKQGNGSWLYGVAVPCGRIADRPGCGLKSALRKICLTCRPSIRLTPQQNLLLVDLAEKDRPLIEGILRRHGVELLDEISEVRRWAMGCPALPTCSLAITECERVLPRVIQRLESELATLRLHDEALMVRMSGCPNGCSRPYVAEIGLVGRGVGKYAVYLGGAAAGERLGFLYKDRVPLDELVPTLVPILIRFKHERREGERFGDFCHRKGAADLDAFSMRSETLAGKAVAG